eukprot:jgi/Mesvir1/16120/Mv08405-RA.1
MASGVVLAAAPVGDGIRRGPGPSGGAVAELQRQLNEAKKWFSMKLQKADKGEASYPFPICLSAYLDASGEASSCFDIDGGLLVCLYFRGPDSCDVNGFAGSVKVCQHSGVSLPRRLTAEIESRILTEWKGLIGQRQQEWSIDRLLKWVVDNLASLLSSVPSQLEAYQTCGEDGMTARRFFFKADSTDNVQNVASAGTVASPDISSQAAVPSNSAAHRAAKSPPSAGSAPGVAPPDPRASPPACSGATSSPPVPSVLPSTGQRLGGQAEPNSAAPAAADITSRPIGPSPAGPATPQRNVAAQFAQATPVAQGVQPSPQGSGAAVVPDEEFPRLGLSALWRRYAPAEAVRGRTHASLSLMLTLRPTDPEWRGANLPHDVRVMLELARVTTVAPTVAGNHGVGESDSCAAPDQAGGCPAPTGGGGGGDVLPPLVILKACSLLPTKGIPSAVMAAGNRMLARQVSTIQGGSGGGITGDHLRSLLRYAENHLGAWEWGEQAGARGAPAEGASGAEDTRSISQGGSQGGWVRQVPGADASGSQTDSGGSSTDSQEEGSSDETWDGDSEGSWDEGSSGGFMASRDDDGMSAREGGGGSPSPQGGAGGGSRGRGVPPNPGGGDDEGNVARGQGRSRQRPRGAADKDTWRRRWELVWDGLEMDNVGTAELACLRLHVACGRCGVGGAEVALVPGGGAAGGAGVCSSTSECQHCHACWTVEMHPRVAHAASNVVAVLRGEATAGAPILDVLPCDVGVSCLECDAVSSLRAVAAGKRCDKVCRKCGHAIGLTFGSTQFRQLVTGRDDLGGQRRAESAGKPGKGGSKGSEPTQNDLYSKLVGGFGGLQLGQELPHRGACQHYHHSFRWLRFPCCGRLFPCDLCHELAMPSDKCTSGVWASRMVCGLCSKEQPFDPQRCSWCMQRIASGRAQTGRSSSRFWEGGRGTRDKHRMNRNDPHKYRNSKLKTVSKKSERVGDAPKKRMQRGQKKDGED